MILPTFHRYRRYGTYFVFVFGILARLAVMKLGSNNDFEAYQIVGEHSSSGENVYVATHRYNYGPVWFLILGLFHRISLIFPGASTFIFRLLIVLLLTAADLLIASIFWRSYGVRSSVFFMLSPISVIITGFHNQFDNLAILIGLSGCLLAVRSRENDLVRSPLLGSVLIGLSLAIKHVLIFLPILMLFSEKKMKNRLVLLVTPYAVFVSSFIPWLTRESWPHIRKNVFEYRSFENFPLLSVFRHLLPFDFGYGIAVILWVVTLVIVALLVRKNDVADQVLIHLVALVAFAPAVANQYLAIANIGLHRRPSRSVIVWVAFATMFLVVDDSGLNKSVTGLDWLPSSQSVLGYQLLCSGLATLLLIQVWNLRSVQRVPSF